MGVLHVDLRQHEGVVARLHAQRLTVVAVGPADAFEIVHRDQRGGVHVVHLASDALALAGRVDHPRHVALAHQQQWMALERAKQRADAPSAVGGEVREARLQRAEHEHQRAAHHITPNVLNASTVLMPRSIASRTRFSVLAFSSARRIASSSAARGITSTPSRSPNTMSPGATRTPWHSTATRQSTTLPRGPWSCA